MQDGTLNQELTLLNITAKEYYSNFPTVINLKDKIETAIKESKNIIIFTDSSVEKASQFIKGFKALDKKIEDLRKTEKEPFLLKGKEIDSFFKELQQMFEKEAKRLENEILAWRRKQEEEARQREAEERKRLEDEAIKDALAKEEELKKAAVDKGEDPTKVKVEIAIVPETVVEEIKLSSHNSSGLSSARYKRFEIVNIELVPREYLCVDEAKVKAERSKYDFTDKSTIPGIRFSFTEGLR
jgi:hypothetical protein